MLVVPSALDKLLGLPAGLLVQKLKVGFLNPLVASSFITCMCYTALGDFVVASVDRLVGLVIVAVTFDSLACRDRNSTKMAAGRIVAAAAAMIVCHMIASVPALDGTPAVHGSFAAHVADAHLAVHVLTSIPLWRKSLLWANLALGDAIAASKRHGSSARDLVAACRHSRSMEVDPSHRTFWASDPIEEILAKVAPLARTIAAQLSASDSRQPPAPRQGAEDDDDGRGSDSDSEGADPEVRAGAAGAVGVLSSGEPVVALPADLALVVAIMTPPSRHGLDDDAGVR